MGSSKTANALMTKFNFEQSGRKVLLLKPYIDNRYGSGMVASRIGLSAPATTIFEDTDLLDMYWDRGNFTPFPDIIIIDECQFLTVDQIEQLKEVSYEKDVFCYGLKNDFTSHLFPASKRLLEIADSISEIKSLCPCGKHKAIISARYEADKVIYDGDIVEVGANERYIGLCYQCWKNGNIHKGE